VLKETLDCTRNVRRDLRGSEESMDCLVSQDPKVNLDELVPLEFQAEENQVLKGYLDALPMGSLDQQVNQAGIASHVETEHQVGRDGME
jgi:prophage tail gpP-like protein